MPTFIHKSPDLRTVASLQDFDKDPGAPWELFDKAAEAWLADAQAKFAPPADPVQADDPLLDTLQAEAAKPDSQTPDNVPVTPSLAKRFLTFIGWIK